MERDPAMNALRSIIPFGQLHSNPNQLFQDTTLRPILKFQHEIILAVYNEFVQVHKINFGNCTLEQRNVKIEQSIKLHPSLQALLKGIVIGLFKKDEMDFWVLNKEEINKRILQLVIKRIQTGITIA